MILVAEITRAIRWWSLGLPVVVIVIGAIRSIGAI
jgi:hypothetical protein